MRYKILLFDLDGTLLDFDKSELFALRKLFAEKGVGPAEEIITTYERVNNALWRRYEKGEISMAELTGTRFGATMREFGMEIDSAVWEKEFRSCLGNVAALMDGAEEILENLSKEHRIFAITNGVGDTQLNRLRLAGLDGYFEQIFVSQLIGIQKPDVGFFDYVGSHIEGFTKADSLVIGDSLLSDIQGGINAGIDTCHVNFNAKKSDNAITPTYEVHSLKELYKVC